MEELRPLNQEEGDALTKDLQEVLLKHGAELGVKANIELLKRVESIKSPFTPDGTNTEDKLNPAPSPEESSKGDNGESTEK